MIDSSPANTKSLYEIEQRLQLMKHEAQRFRDEIESYEQNYKEAIGVIRDRKRLCRKLQDEIHRLERIRRVGQAPAGRSLPQSKPWELFKKKKKPGSRSPQKFDDLYRGLLDALCAFRWHVFHDRHR